MESKVVRKPVSSVREALSKKDSLIPPEHEAAYARAEKEWGNIATTQAGKFAVISAAKEGEETAILYLLKVMLDDGRIKQGLWQFLGPSSFYQRQRIAAGDTAVYRSIVTEALQDVLHHFWNPDKVTSGVDYITNLKYHVIRNVITKITSYGKEQNRGGITGKIYQGEDRPKISSYEDYTDPTKGNEKDVAAMHPAFESTEDFDAWSSFVSDEELNLGAPPTRDILKFFLQRGDFDVEKASETFDKTRQTIRIRVASMKGILEKYGITQDTFLSLLKTYGSKALADTL